MKRTQPASSVPAVDIARFELFLNVFVRSSERRSRRGTRKRWRGQIAKAK